MVDRGIADRSNLQRSPVLTEEDAENLEESQESQGQGYSPALSVDVTSAGKIAKLKRA